MTWKNREPFKSRRNLDEKCGSLQKNIKDINNNLRVSLGVNNYMTGAKTNLCSKASNPKE